MEITRNGQTFELTGKELWKAFEEQRHECLLDDAYRQFCQFAVNKDSLEEASKESLEDFKWTYGIGLPKLLDGGYEEQILMEELVSKFEKLRDCNVAENDTWAAIIKNYLTGLE